MVKNPGVAFDEASLVAYGRERLAADKVPRLVQFVDDLPKTSTGETMRRELKKLDP